MPKLERWRDEWMERKDKAGRRTEERRQKNADKRTDGIRGKCADKGTYCKHAEPLVPQLCI